MFPFITVLGLEISTYSIMALIAAGAGSLLLVHRTKKLGLPLKETGYMMLMVFCGVYSGAVLMHAITKLPVVINHWDDFSTDIGFTIQYLFGGLVFYGGLIGAVVFAYFYIRAYKLDFFTYADLFAPAIPLIHAFGRVGCLLGGCCYGIPMEGGVTFEHSIAFAPDDPARLVERLPVQLIEAVINVFICLILLYLAKKSLKKGSLFCIYLMIYSVVRFVLEFYRGDLVRGVLLTVSTSQWISMALFAVALVGLIAIGKRKPAQADGDDESAALQV